MMSWQIYMMCVCVCRVRSRFVSVAHLITYQPVILASDICMVNQNACTSGN